MANLKNFIFFDDSTTAPISNVFSSPSSASSMTLEVTGDPGFNILVEARVDFKADTWHPLAAIDLGSYEIIPNVTKEGLFSIPLEGISQIRLNNSGTIGGVKVFGIALN